MLFTVRWFGEAWVAERAQQQHGRSPGRVPHEIRTSLGGLSHHPTDASSAQNKFAALSMHPAALFPHTVPSHACSDGLLTRRVDLEPQILLVELSHEPAVWEGGAHASDAHEGAHEGVATREEARQLNTRVVHVARAEQKAARARLRWAAASGRARSETSLAPT